MEQVAVVLDQARKYHQQILVARNIDESKKKEAARTMVRSAVRLIDKLSLASVLVPSRVGDEGGGGGGDGGINVSAGVAISSKPGDDSQNASKSYAAVIGVGGFGGTGGNAVRGSGVFK